MSKKIALEDVFSALQISGVEPEQRKEVMTFIEKLVQEEEDAKPPKQKKAKNAAIVVLKAPDGITIDPSVTAAVFLAKEDFDPDLLLAELKGCAVTQNIKKKGKRTFSLKSFSEVLSFLKPKWLKEADDGTKGIKIVSKQWARCLTISASEDAGFLTGRVEKEEDFS